MERDGSIRRYGPGEVRRIFEAASEADAPDTASTSGLDGLTLGEITEIAAEVGIDPDRVERAARGIAEYVPLEPRVSLGTYQREARFDRLLSQAEMRFVAQEADSYFGVEGMLRQTEGYLEWRSSEARAFVGLVHEHGRTRVRVILDRGSHFLVGGGAIGAIGLASMNAIASGAGGALGVVGAVGAAIATTAAVQGFWMWRRASALRRIEELLKLMTDGPVSHNQPDPMSDRPV